MTETLRIAGLGHRGDGVADGPTEPLYVPYTLPGEVVEVDPVEGHPDRRHLLRVVTPSPERIAPICPHFGPCGGCQLQHWAWPPYHAWKRDQVVTALAQAGLAAEVDTLVDAHGEGRRRAVFHARRATHDILQVGFTGLRTHQLVAIDACPILAPDLAGSVEAAWALAEALEVEQKPLDIQVTATEQGLDVDVRGSGRLSPKRMVALAEVARKFRLVRLTRHGEMVAQAAVPTVTMGRARVPLPPGAFLQATAEGELALARLVAHHVGNAKSVADLFAGVGPFALRLAERARVLAADADEPAITALRKAAANTQGLKPIEAAARDLFRRPFVPLELKGIEAVVFDPPRQGAEAQAHQLAKSRVPVIVAVSCNATTFARDTNLLVAGGYRLTSVTPVDQFRYSAHVEIVARLER